MSAAAAELGNSSILFHNAGIMLLGPIQEKPEDHWAQQIAGQLLGRVRSCSGVRSPRSTSGSS